MKRFIFVLTVSFLVLLLIAGGLWLRESDDVVTQGLVPSLGKNQTDQNSVEVSATVSRVEKRTMVEAAVNDVAVYSIGSGAARESIVMALDEAVLRDEQGKETMAKLQPPATRETLPQRLRELSAVGGVFPVAYLQNQPRTLANRRLVTNELRLEADAALERSLIAKYRLRLKSRPTYAPEWIILAAADPFAALDMMASLREQQGIATADVLLASQRALRACKNKRARGPKGTAFPLNSVCRCFVALYQMLRYRAPPSLPETYPAQLRNELERASGPRCVRVL